MIAQYDRSYSIPVIIDLSDLKEEEAQVVIEGIQKYAPQELKYVSDYAIQVAEEMKAKGYSASFSREMPFEISPTEANVLFANCLKLFCGSSAVRRTPDTSRVVKKIESARDFARIVEDLTLQQDNISVSQIFRTGELPSSVFYTYRRSPLNSRLSRTVLPVPKGGGKKAQEEKVNTLLKLIEEGIELSTVAASANNSMNPSLKKFQYR
jgi:hypothetical protein